MGRRDALAVGIAFLALPLSLCGADTPARQVPRCDVHGDPLPPGAVARLGIVRLRHGSLVRGVALSPDAKVLASCGDDRAVRLWDTATGRALRRLDGHTEVVHEVAYSPDGKLLASASDDTTVRLWDAATGRELRRLSGHGKHVRWVAFSPDGSRLASASWGEVPLLLWDVATGKELRRFETAQPSLDAVHFTPDGKSLVSADRETVQVWDVVSGKRLRQLGDPKSCYGNATAVSPDGKTLALAGYNQGILLWDLATGKELRRLPGHRCGVGALAFSPDGSLLASGSSCREPLRLWNVASGEPVREFPGHHSSVSSLCFARDGRTLASGSWDHTARLWDAATGKDLLPLGGHGAPVEAVAAAPDGQTLATGGYDGTLRLWDGATGRPLHTLARGESGVVRWVTFAPDGKSLFSGDTGGAVSRWDAATGRALGAFLTPARSYGAMAFTPGGRFVLHNGTEDGRLRVRETVAGIAVAQPEGRAPFLLSLDAKLVVCCEPHPQRPGPPHLTGLRPEPAPEPYPGDGNAVLVREIQTGRAIRRIPVGPSFAGPLALSPDGRTLARVMYGDPHYLLSLYEVASGEQRAELKLGPERVHDMQFAPDGRALAVTRGKVVDLWDVATGRRLARLAGHEGDVRAVAFVTDAGGTTRRLVSGGDDTTALVWNVPALPPLHGPSDTDPEVLWRDLASADAATAGRAVWALAGTRGGADWLARRLAPTEPVGADTIRAWVAALDDRSYAARERAVRRLLDVGEPAEAVLREALAGPLSLEAQRRARRVLEQVEARVFSPERLRGVRAVEALERAGTEQARRLLRRLAGGAPGAWLTEEARGALARAR